MQTLPVDSIIASAIIHGLVTDSMPCRRYIVLVCARGTVGKCTESDARDKKNRRSMYVGVGRCKNLGVRERQV